MTNESYDIEKELKEWLHDAKKVVVAGIGNPIRMDDSVGVKIIQELRGRVSHRVFLIECETVPESYIQDIISFNPTHILLIDAALLGVTPGDSRLIQPDKLKIYPTISTHSLPLKIFCDYITETTKAKVNLLLMEPKQTDFGENLTPTLENSVKKIITVLERLL